LDCVLMRRGDIVTVAIKGDAGKPRPALVVQADELFGDLPTVVVLPLTSALADLPLTRVNLEPSAANGLRAASQIMVSRPQSALREKIGGVIGRADDAAMLDVSRKLALLLGLAS
jgi:mRNA interferase MazF